MLSHESAMSPVVRHMCAPAERPHLAGSLWPQSQALNRMSRPGGAQGLAHAAVEIDAAHPEGLVAVVVLEEIDAPVGEGPRVLLLVAVARGLARAGPGARRRVEAELQALRVDVLGERGDAARELVRVPREAPFGGAPVRLPKVVDHDVPVARLPEALGHERVGDAPDEILVDGVAEGVPGVPTHGRRGGDHGGPLLPHEGEALVERDGDVAREEAALEDHARVLLGFPRRRRN